LLNLNISIQKNAEFCADFKTVEKRENTANKKVTGKKEV
jgi:hypothetical protein